MMLRCQVDEGIKHTHPRDANINIRLQPSLIDPDNRHQLSGLYVWIWLILRRVLTSTPSQFSILAWILFGAKAAFHKQAATSAEALLLRTCHPDL